MTSYTEYRTSSQVPLKLALPIFLIIKCHLWFAKSVSYLKKTNGAGIFHAKKTMYARVTYAWTLLAISMPWHKPKVQALFYDLQVQASLSQAWIVLFSAKHSVSFISGLSVQKNFLWLIYRINAFFLYTTNLELALWIRLSAKFFINMELQKFYPAQHSFLHDSSSLTLKRRAVSSQIQRKSYRYPGNMSLRYPAPK